MKKARRASKSRPPRNISKSKNESKPKKVSKISTPRPLRSRVIKTKLPIDRNLVVEPLSVIHSEPPLPEIQELPYSYNETKIVLLVRDPYWAYTYWDFSGETWSWIQNFRERDHASKPILRIHNKNAATFQDIEICLDARNWYLELGIPNAEYEVELGLKDSFGNFHAIARSNRVQTPRNGPSERIDKEWELSAFEFSELYRLSGGGKSSYGSDFLSSFRRH